MTVYMESKKDLSSVFVSKEASLKEVLGVLAKNRPAESGIPAGIVLVVDGKRKLLGIATAGDLTRAIARGVSLEDAVGKMMNPKPFVIEGTPSAQEIIRRVVNETRERGWAKSKLDKVIIVDAAGRVTDLLSMYDLWQGSDIRTKKIGVIGLGYVGLTLGLTLADLGFDVRGFDVNEKVKKLVAGKKAPFFELGLPELLEEHVGKRFRIGESYEEENCDVYFIAVGTPLGTAKKPDLSALSAVANDIGKALKQGDLVVLRSTVPIGTTRGPVARALEKASGLVAGEDFFLAFAPERTVEGKALDELRTLPQVIGGINRQSANLASDIFNLMTHTIHIVDSLEEAEVVKLINNTYRDVTFAFANEVSIICQHWGIDTNTVINAANAGYPRSSVPKPSPGVGGYCLDKDPFIFMEGGRAKGYSAALFKHAREVNTKILHLVADRIIAHLSGGKKGKKRGKDAKIFILGFAFKGRPATSDLRGSPTIVLTKMLQDAGYKNIWGFDPVVETSEIKKLGVHATEDMKRGFKGAEAVIIMNNHEDLASPSIQVLLKECAPGAMFFDTWALHNKDDIAKIEGISYHRL